MHRALSYGSHLSQLHSDPVMCVATLGTLTQHVESAGEEHISSRNERMIRLPGVFNVPNQPSSRIVDIAKILRWTEHHHHYYVPKFRACSTKL